MDASEYEYPSMQRHGARVPTSFYTRFAREASVFAANFASSRLVAVLEGGYSDRALASATAALLTGLCPPPDIRWELRDITALERSCSPAGRKTTDPLWCSRATQIYSLMENLALIAPADVTPMQLRERRTPKNYAEEPSPTPTPNTKPRGGPPKPYTEKVSTALTTEPLVPPPVQSTTAQSNTIQPNTALSTHALSTNALCNTAPPTTLPSTVPKIKLVWRAGGINTPVRDQVEKVEPPFTDWSDLIETFLFLYNEEAVRKVEI